MRDFEDFDSNEFEPPGNRDGLMLGIILGAGVGALLLVAGVLFFLFRVDAGPDQKIAEQQNPQPIVPDAKGPAENNPDATQQIASNQGLGQNKPTNPNEVKPEPVKPVPEPVQPKPEPVQPEPVKPNPEPVKREPVKPAPVQPKPVEPKPEPVKPDPVKPVPAPEIEQPGIPGQRIAYKWVQGEIHSYEMKMVIDRGNSKQELSGNVDLTVGPPVQPKAKPKNVESVEGSGTGFVATADGHIVTCAHVVRDATKIEVQLNGKTYGATVIAIEPDDDLAVLKIDAKDLAVLSLAKSAEVQLAQEIRSIGFPLSDVLGDGLKITAGVVSGVVVREGRKRFQVDAAINPGNSGGPVVNLRGEVVGVASSKLVGLAVDKVGFCVPSDAVAKFLAKHKLTPLITQGAKADLPGPELFQSVKPTLALIKVTINPAKMLGDLVKLSTYGHYSTKIDGRRVIGFGSSMRSSYGSVNIDQFGQVTEFKDNNQLPFLTGPMSLLALQNLDRDGRNQWTVKERISISIQKEDRRGPRRPRSFGPRFRIPDPLGRNDANVVKHVALEEGRYVLKEKTEDALVIAKTFSLRTQDDAKNPLVSITGSGTITFNRKTGLVDSYEFAQTYAGNQNGKRVAVPITISMNRVEAAVLADRIRKSADSLALAEAKRATQKPKVEPKTDAQKLDEVLKKINQTVAQKRSPWVGLSSLAKLNVVPDRQDEVEVLLVGLLESKDNNQLKTALEALTKWGTKASVTDIVPHLSHSLFTVPQAAAKALGAIGDESAIDPLIEALKTNKRSRRYVAAGLIPFGAKVEDKVIPLLESNDRDMLQAVCDILKAVGGKKSIAALTPLAEGQDFLRKTYAGRAIKPIQARVDLLGDDEGEPGSSPAVRRIDALIAKLKQEGVTDLERIQTLNQLVGQTLVAERKAEVEQQLLRILKSDNASLKLQTLMAMKKWGTQASVAGLTKIALEGNALSVIALDALTGIADKSISDIVAPLVVQPKIQAVAFNFLRKVGLNTAAEKRLSEALKQAPLSDQAKIIEILGLHGSIECLPALEAIAASNKPTVTMKAAANAAARIRLRGDSLG